MTAYTHLESNPQVPSVCIHDIARGVGLLAPCGVVDIVEVFAPSLDEQGGEVCSFVVCAEGCSIERKY
jgi:hypothetical protein